MKKEEKKKYTEEDIGGIFEYVIMPHFVFMLLLCVYIIFRFSKIEGIILFIIALIFSYFINKWNGLI